MKRNGKEPRARVCTSLKSSLFQDLSEEQKKLLLNHSVEFRLRPGEKLFVAGGLSTYVYWVHSGLIKLTSEISEGKSHTFALCGPGRLMGMESLFNRPVSLNAEAILPSVCYQFEANDFRGMVTVSSAFAFDLLDHVHQALENTYRRMATMAHFSTERRLLALFCEMMCEERENGCKVLDRTLALGLNQTQLAEVLGTSRVSVNKVINDFERRGLLHYRGRTFEIRNFEGLFQPHYDVTERRHQ